MSEQPEHALIAERRRKLEAQREAGEAYANDFRRNALAGDLHLAFGEHEAETLESEGIPVAVAGRMMAKRVMGKASFARLEDMSGAIQLFMQRDALPEGVYAAFKTWDLGDLIGVEGTLFKTRTGELSVKVSRARLLSKCLRPLPEKYHGLADTETRYRQRYLDLVMNEDSRAVFRLRSRMVTFMRRYLDAQGFLEVETPMMQPIPGGANARPFVTHHNALGIDMYLRIAPELYLKRLVVGGFERVYEINRNFRNEGLSTRHNPEFTMLELYQAWVDQVAMMDIAEHLLRSMAEALLGTLKLASQGVEVDLEPAFRRVALETLVLEANPGLDAARSRDVDHLREIAAQLDMHVEPGWGAGKLLLELFEKTVEPDLQQPTFVTGYPLEVSPLARCRDTDPFLTDRFELFIAGRELANGFSELNDPEEQAARFRAQVAQKSAGDEEAMFYDADYVRALEYGMPPAGGLGIGVDRLVMLYADQPSIRDVLLFPQMRPEEPPAG
ncbi:lysine--tRNA ligase [Wenzhouxiangella sp. XN24]|uniref:lysine--tRNA ligase n=1 Tax=Wenzhouxiangella sp. XN24 TaxID=2713569 RepID=UPI0013EBB02A|nr:lysine--tRNA ligase [Wenzhouxiangella sp. XN24]NGX16760.1 lysine--tRNA ligase [Wenzhouxiangella sp. XN24]